MQETAKVNYVHYWNASKKAKNKPRPSGSSGSSGSRFNTGNPGNPMERAGKFHYPLTSLGNVEKVGTRKVNLVELWKHFAQTVNKGSLWESVYEEVNPLGECSGTSTNSEPDYFNEHGDHVYAHIHMVHIKETNQNKHLIPISHWYRFQESEDLTGLFHCSVKSWHWYRCKFDELYHIW